MRLVDGFLEDARDVHRGRKTLGKSFWLWLYLPHLILGGLLLLLSFNYVRLSELGVGRGYGTLEKAIQAVLFLWVIYFGIGVWRSAGHAQSKFWGIVTRIVMVFWFLYAASIPLDWFGVSPKTSGDLGQTVGIANQQLPMKLDDDTTLTRLELKGDAVTYRIEIKGNLFVDPNAVETMAKKDGCSEFDSYFRSGVLSRVDYDYWSDKTLVYRYILGPKACG